VREDEVRIITEAELPDSRDAARSGVFKGFGHMARQVEIFMFQ
jgi:hypothetical protein